MKGKGYAKGHMNPKSKKDVTVKEAKKGFGQTKKKEAESKSEKFRNRDDILD